MSESLSWSFVVGSESSGERLDVYVAAHVPEVSRSRARRLIDEGNVLVRGAPQKPSYRVRPGDVVDVTVPPPEPTDIVPEPLDLDVVYEDRDILVVNKPRGMVVHPAKGHWRETMVNALLFRCRVIENVGDLGRPGIVHRLDKDTTGLVVVAKTERSFSALQDQIRSRVAKRDYLAIVSGVVEEDRGTVEAPIGRHRVDRKKMAVVEGGRPAVTRFEVLCRFRKHTLIEAHLETGRTHQIRVHMRYIRHPVVGDAVYGRKAGELGLQGQALHAWQLKILHPADGALWVFRAPPPADFLNAVRLLDAELAGEVSPAEETGSGEENAKTASDVLRTQAAGKRKEIVSWVLGIRKEWLRSCSQ